MVGRVRLLLVAPLHGSIKDTMLWKRDRTGRRTLELSWLAFLRSRCTNHGAVGRLHHRLPLRICGGHDALKRRCRIRFHLLFYFDSAIILRMLIASHF